jgi:hypothetical protein
MILDWEIYYRFAGKKQYGTGTKQDHRLMESNRRNRISPNSYCRLALDKVPET